MAYRYPRQSPQCTSLVVSDEMMLKRHYYMIMYSMEGSDGGQGTFHDARRSNEGLNPVATITASTPPMALASNSTLCVTSAKTLTHSTHMISESPNPSISQYPKKNLLTQPLSGTSGNSERTHKLEVVTAWKSSLCLLQVTHTCSHLKTFCK